METPDEGTKPCPFCGETIRLTAIKCRFCSEMLTGLRPGDQVMAVASHSARPARGMSPLRKLLGVGVLAAIGFVIFQSLRTSATHSPNLSERKFKQKTTFMYIPVFQGLKVRSFSKTATLPAGEWTVVVANSENIINTMVVHLRVVADPSS